MDEVLTDDELAEWLPTFLADLTPESPAVTPDSGRGPRPH